MIKIWRNLDLSSFAPLSERFSDSMSPLVLRLLNTAAFAFCIVISALAGATKVFGASIGTLSNQNPTLVTPASYAFLIWNVIFILNGLLVVFFWFDASSGVMRSIGPWNIVINILNPVWDIVWLTLGRSKVFWPSAVILVLLTVSIGIVHLYVGMGEPKRPTWIEAIVVDAFFSIYLGWTIAATLVNLAVVFRPSAQVSVVILALNCLISLTYAVLFADPFVPLVGAWALGAISVAAAANSQTLLHTSSLTFAIVSAIAAAVSFCIWILWIVRPEYLPYYQRPSTEAKNLLQDDEL